jgi:hypothetical protein
MPSPRRWFRSFVAAVAVLAFVLAGCSSAAPSPSSPSDIGRVFVEALGGTRYVSALSYLAPSLKATTTDQSLKTSWDTLATKYGKFKGEGTIATTPAADGTDVAVPVTFAAGSATVHVTVNSALQIVDLAIPSSGVAAPSASPSSS